MRAKKKELLSKVRKLTLNGRPDQAIELINEYCLKNKQADFDLFIIKGNILEGSGQFDEAYKQYRKVLKHDPENSAALIDIGDYYYGKEMFVRASRYYSLAIRSIEGGRVCFDKEDELVEAYIGKANASLELNKQRQALNSIVKGLQKYPENTLLANALQKVQDRSKH